MVKKNPNELIWVDFFFNLTGFDAAKLIMETGLIHILNSSVQSYPWLVKKINSNPYFIAKILTNEYTNLNWGSDSILNSDT